MTKLLIADDEPLICVGIRSMLPWEDYDIEIAGTARNGQQALEMIESLRPEIVITDIKMPLKSGLEVAEECSKKYGYIPLFIILTSFEEFDLVRRALSAQAVDYLVKLELSPESLGASINKALSLLEKILRTKAPLSGEPMLENTQRLRDEFFHNLYQRRIESARTFSQKRDSLGLKLSSPTMTVAVGEVSGHDNGGNGTSHSLSAVWMLREMLERLYPCYVTPLENGRFTILFCLEDKDPCLLRKQYEAGLLKTIGIIHDYLNVHIRIAAGQPVEDPLKLDESFHSACEELEEMGNSGSKGNPLCFFEKSLQRQKHQQQIVSRVEEYIRNNLDKRLTLTEVATEFNISPNYLSQLFTRYAGEGFVEYITAAKIAAAKTMLLKGEGLVYEIAEKLGYESAFYFSKVFKKVEGSSPREFLSRHEITLPNTPASPSTALP